MGGGGISVVVTAHREGTLLLPTFQSARVSAEALAKRSEVPVEFVISLDRPDAETQAVAASLPGRLTTCDAGDPGANRLHAVAAARHDFIAFLDGDDLWSSNWLCKAWDLMQVIEPGHRETCMLHPEYNLIFGAHSMLVRQGDPEDPFFDLTYLRSGNYWDALSFCHRRIYEEFPFLPNDPANGIAHEDFHLSCVTVLNGVEHLLVPGTVHFKRRRGDSVSVKAEERSARPRFTELNFYGFYGRSGKAAGV